MEITYPSLCIDVNVEKPDIKELKDAVNESRMKLNLLNQLKEELNTKNIINKENFNEKLLDSYNIIGFDVDHTLEVYNMIKFPRLLYSCFSQYLVEYEYYPVNLNIFDKEIESQNMKHELLNFLTVNNFEQYACNEILLDFQYGNALKIAEDLSILKAFHGMKELTREDIFKTYDKGKFPANKRFNYHRTYTEDYFYIRGYVNLHICSLFIFCVELFDLNFLPDKISYKNIFLDIYEGLNFSYKKNENSSESVGLLGYYNPDLQSNIKDYLNEAVNSNEKIRVKKTLENLKAKGKKLFFATNSAYEYCDMILRNSLGEDYKNLFEFCFYNAEKPRFFRKQNEGNFSLLRDSKKYSLSHIRDEKLFERIKQEKSIILGSYKLVETLFTKVREKETEKERILFIGDNFSSDCAIPSFNENWDTIAVDESLFTGYIGIKNENLSIKWKMNFSDFIKEYRFKIIRESVKMAITNVQLLDIFL